MMATLDALARRASRQASHMLLTHVRTLLLAPHNYYTTNHTPSACRQYGGCFTVQRRLLSCRGRSTVYAADVLGAASEDRHLGSLADLPLSAIGKVSSTRAQPLQ